MKYQALYRKYRPKVFDDVKGQDVIIRTLKNQVKTGRIAHAYLFCGSRGTGKTTCAKILAKAINCEHPQDGDPCMTCDACKAISAGTSMNVIEMDAASQRGIDHFRQIISEIAYPPTDGKYKVYIIDEVHMLTSEAFNAFLKTLEEPPEYAVFILATTDPQKLLPTVLSRCQRFDFKRIPTKVIEMRLAEVMETEGIRAEAEAIHMIARRAEGGLRDALSIADQCASFFPGECLTQSRVLEVIGTVDLEVFRTMLRAAERGNAAKLIRLLDECLMDGRDIRQIVSDFTWYLRDLLLYKASGGAEAMNDLIEEDLETMAEDADILDENRIMYYIEILSELSSSIRFAGNRRVLTEIALINMCRPEGRPQELNALYARIAQLEQKFADGIVTADIPQQTESERTQYAGMQPVDLNSADGAVRDASAEQNDAISKTVAPELFRKISDQWIQTVSSIKDQNVGVSILRTQAVLRYAPEEADVLFIELPDCWVAGFRENQDAIDSVRKAISEKYGTNPEIRFVAASESGDAKLKKVDEKMRALQEKVNFPIGEEL